MSVSRDWSLYGHIREQVVHSRDRTDLGRCAVDSEDKDEDDDEKNCCVGAVVLSVIVNDRDAGQLTSHTEEWRACLQPLRKWLLPKE